MLSFWCSLPVSLLPVVVSSKILWISVKDCFAGEWSLVCKCSPWIRSLERRISACHVHSLDEIRAEGFQFPHHFVDVSFSLSNFRAAVCVSFSSSNHSEWRFDQTQNGSALLIELLDPHRPASAWWFWSQLWFSEDTVIGLRVGANGDPQLANKLVSFSRLDYTRGRPSGREPELWSQLNSARAHKNAEGARLIVQNIVDEGTELTTFNKIDKLDYFQCCSWSFRAEWVASQFQSTCSGQKFRSNAGYAAHHSFFSRRRRSSLPLLLSNHFVQAKSYHLWIICRMLAKDQLSQWGLSSLLLHIYYIHSLFCAFVRCCCIHIRSRLRYCLHPVRGDEKSPPLRAGLPKDVKNLFCVIHFRACAAQTLSSSCVPQLVMRSD